MPNNFKTWQTFSKNDKQLTDNLLGNVRTCQNLQKSRADHKEITKCSEGKHIINKLQGYDKQWQMTNWKVLTEPRGCPKAGALEKT